MNEVGLICPCHSGGSYIDCCASLHKGRWAEHPVKLMRSRYSAYAMGNVEYILATNHPDTLMARADILSFCRSTLFIGLHVRECTDDGDIGYVSFKAVLRQGQYDTSFTEKSCFIKKNGQWLYLDGIII